MKGATIAVSNHCINRSARPRVSHEFGVFAARSPMLSVRLLLSKGRGCMIERINAVRVLIRFGILSLALLMSAASSHLASAMSGQETKAHPIESRLQVSADGPAIEFTVPKDYMRSDIPPFREQRYKGLMMLDAGRPTGLFIALVEEGRSADEIETAIESIVKGMFVHGSKPEPTWETATLPAHEGMAEESGRLWIGRSKVQDIQMAIYRCKVGKQPLVYAYFAMQDKTGTMKEPNGKFVDATGNGVKAFDKFWHSIKEAR